MKTIKLLGILLIISFKLYSQGSNNDFDYDNEDFNIIFRELGISAFKFPVQHNSNQIFDIVIEEYENKELIKKISIIDVSKVAFG